MLEGASSILLRLSHEGRESRTRADAETLGERPVIDNGGGL